MNMRHNVLNRGPGPCLARSRPPASCRPSDPSCWALPRRMFGQWARTSQPRAPRLPPTRQQDSTGAGTTDTGAAVGGRHGATNRGTERQTDRQRSEHDPLFAHSEPLLRPACSLSHRKLGVLLASVHLCPWRSFRTGRQRTEPGTRRRPTLPVCLHNACT